MLKPHWQPPWRPRRRALCLDANAAEYLVPHSGVPASQKASVQISVLSLLLSPYPSSPTPSLSMSCANIAFMLTLGMCAGSGCRGAVRCGSCPPRGCFDPPGRYFSPPWGTNMCSWCWDGRTTKLGTDRQACSQDEAPTGTGHLPCFPVLIQQCACQCGYKRHMHYP